MTRQLERCRRWIKYLDVKHGMLGPGTTKIKKRCWPSKKKLIGAIREELDL